MEVPNIADIRATAHRIAPFVHNTPVLTSSAIDNLVGAKLFFKCENLQKVGAFKIRGATNCIFTLPEKQAASGVATHSSGNHGAALAQAARWRGIKATVVMPNNAPAVKKKAVMEYGAEIVLCEPTLEAREASLETVVSQTGAVFVPPYNDYRIIAGQATVALEIFEQIRDLDVIMVPLGGGGLLSGSALATHAISPHARIIGVEPENANDGYRSFHAGVLIPAEKPSSIADGLLTSLGSLTWPIIKDLVDDIVTVSEVAIVSAMRLIWERMKLVIEPSAAVPLGALLSHRVDLFGKRVGVILSGGNVDLDDLPW